MVKNLFLHCCCAPCALEPVRRLMETGHTLTLYYSNDNIHPESEYQLRRDCLVGYAKEVVGLELLVPDYQPEAWHQMIGSAAGVFPLIPEAVDYEEMLVARQKRCRLCYSQRFTALAEAASERGFSQISTTLSISPWQFTELLEEELSAAAARCGLQAHFVDWREDYPQSRVLSRELGLYRQKYCGCQYSRQEADIEREAARQRRRHE
ncbi:MAG: epoxyqueuosine reductase QueH [Coriobacteriales bacterium]|nr:epoxyqueuosine reductase QueH [Coriobacteriales bacterium]